MDEKEQKHKEVAEKAAETERKGDYEKAARYWTKASLLTAKSAEFNWCNARSQFCQRMATRPFTGK